MPPPPTGWHARRSSHSGPPWGSGHPWARKRRFVFLGFLVVFGVFTIFLTAAILAVLFLIEGRPPLGLHRPGAWLGAACLVPLVFFALVFTFGGLAFRRFGTPLADVMAAADAVADGDLEVRLREDTPGELGRLAQSFNRMTAELARTEQQRRNLTADVAHELRTPLHIIQGNLEGILDGVYEPDSEHISATLEETRLLARLVNDLQTLSLAEAGQLPLHKVKIAAADLLEDVAASFSGQATEQGIALQVEIDPSVQIPEFSADPDRLDQVLSNLVANALRYTPQGGRIVLRARQLPEGVRLEVQDTGAGVAPEDLPYLFDRFWRGDRSRTRAGGAGSGLGLAIAKQLVQAHGGRIGVESRLGEGTTFRIDMALGDG